MTFHNSPKRFFFFLIIIFPFIFLFCWCNFTVRDSVGYYSPVSTIKRLLPLVQLNMSLALKRTISYLANSRDWYACLTPASGCNWRCGGKTCPDYTAARPIIMVSSPAHFSCKTLIHSDGLSLFMISPCKHGFEDEIFINMQVVGNCCTEDS